MIKIGFVIAASTESPWRDIHYQGQKKTWLSELGKDDFYIASYSTGESGESWVDPDKHWKLQYDSKMSRKHNFSDPVFFESNSAMFKGVKGYGSLVSTSFSAIDYLLKNNQCDYIVRTNVSSYWNINALREFLTSNREKNYYSGSGVKLFRNIIGLLRHDMYASGAGIVMSADTANLFVKNFKKVPQNLIDDMAIGRLAFKLGIRHRDLPRIDLGKLSDVEKLSRYDLLTNFHYRCKSYTYNNGRPIRGDVEIMERLHVKVNEHD